MLPNSARDLFILLLTATLACYKFVLLVLKFLKQSVTSVGSLCCSCNITSSLPQQGKQAPAPSTIAIILAECDPLGAPINKLANLIAWCFEGEASQALVYHPRGLSQEQADHLTLLLPPGFRLQRGFGNGGTAVHPPAKTSAEYPSRRTTAPPSLKCGVWLLSGADAERPLIEAAAAGLQKVATSGDCDVIDPCRLDVPLVTTSSSLTDELLRCTGGCVALEPDLALVCGDAFTTAGFPPWLLRFSELYHLKPLLSVSQADVKAALCQYSKVKQRFGM